MSIISWKGINSNTIPGLLICNLPPITKPKMRTEVITIDGVDGDIINDLGYESYDREVQIGLTRGYDINEIINYFNGEGDLILSNEPDKCYNAKIINKIDYENLLNFKTATVIFHCQPFKHSILDESTTYYIGTSIGENVNVSFDVVNNGYEKSKPIIDIEGNEGDYVNFYVNENQIFNYTFDSDGRVVIDCENQEAYYGNVLKNRNMVGEFPILLSGINKITLTGKLTKYPGQILINPRSRWL